MLVLSRRIDETIRFPQLGIAVSIVSVKGNRVQVGIDAPPEIRVIRKELESNSQSANCAPLSARSGNHASPPKPECETERHDFKNRLNRATLGLHLAQKQLAAGRANAAEETLSTALARLMELEKTAFVGNAMGKKDDVTATNFPHDPAEQRVSRFESQKTPSNNVEVLLVEDDPNEQALLRSLLEMEGYHVHTANNGVEALKCLERVTPQFVLLDMTMPACDGPETLERLRAIPALIALPVLAVSGTSPESLGVSIGSGGVEDWFPKPLNTRRLIDHLRDRLGSLSS